MPAVGSCGRVGTAPVSSVMPKVSLPGRLALGETPTTNLLRAVSTHGCSACTIFFNLTCRCLVPARGSVVIGFQLMRRREFMLMNALKISYGAGICGLFNFVSLYAQIGCGMRHAATDLSTPRAFAMVGGSLLAALLDPTAYIGESANDVTQQAVRDGDGDSRALARLLRSAVPNLVVALPSNPHLALILRSATRGPSRANERHTHDD